MSLFSRYYYNGMAMAVFEPGEAPHLEPVDVAEVWRPTTDVVETERGWLVRMELGGVAAEDVRVRVGVDQVTVNGLRRPWCPSVREGRPTYRRMEIRHGLFSREIPVPGPVCVDAARAKLRDGLLEISLPREPDDEAEPPVNGWIILTLAR